MSSKLLKSELKQIVKECLVEILHEGISSDISGDSKESISHAIRDTSASRRSSFDHTSWAKGQSSSHEHDNDKPDYIEQAKNLTDNSILAEVLADSHKTMIGQIEAERMGKAVAAGDLATREAASSDPMDLFGDAAGKWAALAFDKK